MHSTFQRRVQVWVAMLKCHVKERQLFLRLESEALMALPKTALLSRTLFRLVECYRYSFLSPVHLKSSLYACTLKFQSKKPKVELDIISGWG